MQNDLISFLIGIASTKKDILWAVIVSAIVSAAVSYGFKRRETLHKAQVDYEYEQRKKLREVIGRYHGRLISAAESMNHRMSNLYVNCDKGWLEVNADYASAGYYFNSFVYRFLNVCTLIRQLEKEAILLDARIAEKNDFAFLNYASALQWVMTDVALFNGLPYDNSRQHDHFFSDEFRHYSDLCLTNEQFPTFEDFKANICSDERLERVFGYFKGLKKEEQRLRWDRLVAFHLLLMAFLNMFGYNRQKSSNQTFLNVAGQIKNQRVLENLVSWIPKHDLSKNSEAKKIIRASNMAGT